MKMLKVRYRKRLKHSPTDLKKKLPKQINHNILKLILEYLEKSNKIAFSLKGITWVYNSNPNLRRAIATGLEI